MTARELAAVIRTLSQVAGASVACAMAHACSPGSQPDASADAGLVVDGGSDGGVDPDTGIRELAYTPVPRSRMVEPGVRREVFTVTAPSPPPNTGGKRPPTPTPITLDAVQVVRYRSDATPATPARAIIIAMPGFLGGAGTFDPLARALVRRGTMASQAVEVWAIDRRSNLLEDLRGMEAAEAMHDPEIAHAYYLERTLRLNGEAFRGFLDAREASISYISEWGLASTVNDLRAVIATIPDSKNHVVLLGHSLGASVAESFAGWDFDGTPGYQLIAGVALIDGALSGTEITEDEYRNGSPGGGGRMAFPGVTGIRNAGPYYFALPVLGVRANVISEIVARRAQTAPEGVVADGFRDILFRTLLGITEIPPLNSAAAMGFAFDDGSNPLAFARMSVGRPVEATRDQANTFGMGGTIAVPSDPSITYTWMDAPATSPREFTPIANAANAWAATPTNFAEWYFPQRLSLDLTAVGTMRIADGQWQATEGLRARHGGQIDAPMLAIGAGFYSRAGAFDGARTRLSPTVGPGRPNAGATRTDPRGFRAITVPGMTHIDPLTASDDNPANPVPESLASFALANTVGTVVVPGR